MRRFAAPAFMIALGFGWLIVGIIGLVADEGASATMWLVGGAVLIACGTVRHSEIRRGKRFTGVLGVIAWVSTPVLWARSWYPRPPR